jgi:hypothetical protein
MRRSILATVFCVLALPCGAGILDDSPAKWHWPPFAADPPPPSAPPLSPVLVSGLRYGTGLTDDLLHAPAAGFDEAGFELAFADKRGSPKSKVAVEKPPVPMQDVCDALVTSAHRHNLPVPFFIRLIWQESEFDSHAVSRVGAQGVAQFMPETANAVGLEDPFDPIRALQASARLLRDLITQFGNLGLAAAAYNAGPKRIVDWLQHRGSLPNETRNYVLKITGHLPDRWRRTEPGRLALEVPKRAPCQAATEFAAVVEVPAPLPPPVPKPKPQARTRLLAKHQDKDAHQRKDKDIHQAKDKDSREANERKAPAGTRQQVVIDVAASHAGRKAIVKITKVKESRPKASALAQHAPAPARSAKTHDVASAKRSRTASAKRGRTQMAMGSQARGR